MATNTKNPQVPAPATTTKTGSSKIGAILSVLALIFAAIGSALVHAKYKSATPVVTTGDKVGEAIGKGTMHGLAVIVAVPMLVAAIALAGTAIILIVVKLRKVKPLGLFTSALWVLISVWGFKISIAAFSLIKAR